MAGKDIISNEARERLQQAREFVESHCDLISEVTAGWDQPYREKEYRYRYAYTPTATTPAERSLLIAHSKQSPQVFYPYEFYDAATNGRLERPSIEAASERGQVAKSKGDQYSVADIVQVFPNFEAEIICSHKDYSERSQPSQSPICGRYLRFAEAFRSFFGSGSEFSPPNLLGDIEAHERAALAARGLVLIYLVSSPDAHNHPCTKSLTAEFANWPWKGSLDNKDEEPNSEPDGESDQEFGRRFARGELLDPYLIAPNTHARNAFVRFIRQAIQVLENAWESTPSLAANAPKNVYTPHQSDMEIMQALRQAQHRLNRVDIVAASGRSDGVVKHRLKSLEAAGYVGRPGGPRHGYSLTKKGRQAMGRGFAGRATRSEWEPG